MAAAGLVQTMFCIGTRRQYVQAAALGQSQGFVKSYPQSSIGCLGVLQLLCWARKKLQGELLKRNKQNLYDRPSAARCI